MKTVRASEISAYLYCQRAWWYQRNGYLAENQSELGIGALHHERHGRSVLRVQILRWLAYSFLIAALGCAIIAIIASIQ